MYSFSTDSKQEFFNDIKEIVYTILRNENILNGNWHLGRVESVISPTLLSVYVDNSKTAQKIPCNPKVEFAAGDEVFVLFVNGRSVDKFVPFHRGIPPVSNGDQTQ